MIRFLHCASAALALAIATSGTASFGTAASTERPTGGSAEAGDALTGARSIQLYEDLAVAHLLNIGNLASVLRNHARGDGGVDPALASEVTAEIDRSLLRIERLRSRATGLLPRAATGDSVAGVEDDRALAEPLGPSAAIIFDGSRALRPSVAALESALSGPDREAVAQGLDTLLQRVSALLAARDAARTQMP